MLKLDPQSMNKAIISKIKSLNSRYPSSITRLSEMQREVDNGLREMQDLDRKIVDNCASSTRVLSPQESINNDNSQLKKQINSSSHIGKFNKASLNARGKQASRKSSR